MNKKLKYDLLASLCIPALLLASATAHATSFQQQSGLWTNITLKGQFTHPRWHYVLQLENRLRDKSPLQRATLIRPIVGYTVTQTTSLWLGYTAEPSLSSSRQWSYNSNIFEQVEQTLFQNQRLKLDLRLRQEQRFNNRHSGVAHRTRVRIGAVLPFAQTHWDWIINGEVFFNLNHPTWVSKKALSQNRMYFGLRYQFNPHQTINFGYLNRTDFNSNTTTMNHIAFIGWTLSF